MQMNPQMKMFMQMMKNSGNPQQMVLSMLESRAGNNPMLYNLLTLAQQGKETDVEQIARNLMKSKGIDFDKEFGDFKNMFGL